jgi:RimJ/RimL family protein N-acetyltransferase
VHICKACAKLSKLVGQELEIVGEIEFIVDTQHFSQKNLDWLIAMSASDIDPKAAKLAKSVLVKNDKLPGEFGQLIIEKRIRKVIVAETNRLILRELKPDDIAEIQNLQGQPEIMSSLENGFTIQDSFNDTSLLLTDQIYRYKDDGNGYYVVILKEEGKLIGLAGIFESMIGGEPITELGYIFGQVNLGQGYAKKAVKALIRFSLRSLRP